MIIIIIQKPVQWQEFCNPQEEMMYQIEMY